MYRHFTDNISQEAETDERWNRGSVLVERASVVAARAKLVRGEEHGVDVEILRVFRRVQLRVVRVAVRDVAVAAQQGTDDGGVEVGRRSQLGHLVGRKEKSTVVYGDPVGV